MQGTGFPHAERERLGVRGLLPPGTLSMERQVASLSAQHCIPNCQRQLSNMPFSHVKTNPIQLDENMLHVTSNLTAI